MRLVPRTLWLAVAVGSAGLVMASFGLTAWLGLHPCHLCIFQRLLFGLIAGTALASALLAPAWARGVAGVLAAALAAAGAAVAAYQSWLQAQPPDTVSCVGSEPGLIERLVEWLGQQAPALFLATGFCAEEELVILGLSLANWALVCFLLFLVTAAWAMTSRQVPTTD